MGADMSKTLDELQKAQEVPPFRADGPRYDMSSFIGRTLHFYSVNDPRTLLNTTRDVRDAEKLLSLYRAGDAPLGTTDDDLWRARRVLESSLHPDTGEPIFPLFRFSAFVPVNMIVVTATVTPAVLASFPATAAVHFTNQTYNAAINYANRNASNPVPQARLIEGYAGAVATSLTIGLAATALTKKVVARGVGGPAVNIIRSTMPFLAVALAGASNVVLMRRNELTTGVDVFDDDGNELGKSVEAGKVGLAKCAAARIIWNIPVMMFPPLIMSRLERLKSVASSPRLRIACETAVVTTCLLGAVSPALAFFPQRDTLPVEALEDKFKGLMDKTGKPVTRIWYNKGL